MRKLKIALIDDDNEFLRQLHEYVDKATAEISEKGTLEKETIRSEVTEFSGGLHFFSQYRCNYDLIFLDVEMPGMDGMSVARQIREMDERVGIVFVTNIAQYALQGYEVNAIDFIVKPLDYFRFFYRFQKALRFCTQNRETDLILQTSEQLIRIPLSEIQYLEKDRNYIIYHTKEGTFRERGTITEYEKAYEDAGFSRCNSGCMVNLQYVKKVTRDGVCIGNEVLPVSRSRRKEFMDNLMHFLER